MKRKFKEWWSTILPIIKQNEQLSLSPQTVEHKKVFFKKCKPKLIYLVKKKLRLFIAWISIHLEKKPTFSYLKKKNDHHIFFSSIFQKFCRIYNDFASLNFITVKKLSTIFFSSSNYFINVVEFKLFCNS